jgi:Flp pilus assembly protein TadD
MPRLSVVMIVRNEAHCLATCLESARAITDQFVVVDTGSSDSTVAIARGYGARVDTFPWCDDFAAARNHALQFADGDWILHLDADEELDAEGARRLRALVDADGEGHDAIEVTLANYCNAPRAWRWTPVDANDAHARGKAGYLAVGLLRLFRNGRGFEYREAVHENITASVLERGGRILRAADIVIHHHGYDASPKRAKEKALFYLALAQKKRDDHPGDPKALCDFAEQAFACGLPDEAEHACRDVLALQPAHLEAGTLLANLLLNRGALPEARAVLETLEAAGHGAPHLGTAIAAIDYREGNLDAALHRLNAVLAEAPRLPMARLYLARVHDCAGDTERALREFEILRDLLPGITEFQDLLRAHKLRRQGEQLFRAGFAAQALDTLVEALRLDPEDPLTHNNLGVVLHQMGEKDRARASFQRALQLAPGLSMAEDNLAGL